MLTKECLPRTKRLGGYNYSLLLLTNIGEAIESGPKGKGANMESPKLFEVSANELLARYPLSC